MNRKEVLSYVKEHFGVDPESPWAKWPENIVLRHGDNNKWFGIIMNVSRDKLGLLGTEPVDILDVKCDPDMIGTIRTKDGILPGYHMNKNHWISILLDATVEREMVEHLLTLSFQMTETKKKRGK